MGYNCSKDKGINATVEKKETKANSVESLKCYW